MRTKLDVLEVIIVSGLVILVLMLGSYLGVNKYKHSCEKIENQAQTQTWLECKV